MKPSSSQKNLKLSSFMDFESWMNVLNQEALSSKDQDLFMKGLQECPEWVNQSDQFLTTPLMRASEFGQIEFVKGLIRAGADLNLKNLWGKTALMRAVMRDSNQKVVKALIKAGADLNLQDPDGWTALMKASSSGRTEVVKALLEAGSDPNLQDQDGWTALMVAAHRSRLEVVQALVTHGVDPSLLNKNQQTALDLAKKKGHHDVIGLLEAHTERQVLDQAVTSMETPSSLLPSKETDSLRASKGLRL